MQRFKQDSTEWLAFDLLADCPHVKHAVFLRHGGHSQAPFNSLNASFSVGDQAAAIEQNRALIAKQSKAGLQHWSHIVTGQGCHGKHISYIEKQSPHVIPQCDGLISSTPGITLMMTHADCQIALFYDPCHHAIANVHAGWRGSVQNIYAETLLHMQKRFGSKPADLLVCISPSLGPDESEFIHYRNELPEKFWTFQIKPTYFDFWSISEYQLQNAGILPHHIEIARLSTHSNAYDFFSYRRDKITGRHATCITLL